MLECDASDNENRQDNPLTFKVVFNGEQMFNFENKELILFPDSFLCMPAGTAYTSNITAFYAVKTLSVAISSHFLEDFKKRFKSNRTIKFIDKFNLSCEYIHALGKDMGKNFEHLYRRLQDEEDDETLLNEYLYQCLYIYYKARKHDIERKLKNLNFVRPTTKIDILRRLNLAREFISNNYNQNIGIDEMAAAACLSSNHLLRTFKQAYSISPFQYLSQVRLQRARILLETVSDPVQDIVYQVGFESASSFIKSFRAKFNITPSKYRRTILMMKRVA